MRGERAGGWGSVESALGMHPMGTPFGSEKPVPRSAAGPQVGAEHKNRLLAWFLPRQGQGPLCALLLKNLQ